MSDQAPVAEQANSAPPSAAPSAADGQQATAGPSRTVQVFRPPSASGSQSAVPLSYSRVIASSDDPKPTPAELKEAFKDHIAQRHGPDAPLMTKAMREKEEARLNKNKKTWSAVKIRIRFADRTQVESAFPSNATIAAIYSFVRDSLHPDIVAAQKKFTLFTTPPRKDFAEDDPKLKGKGLQELGWVPAAVLSIRWDDANLNSTSTPAPLRPELLSSAVDLPPPKTFEEPSAGPSGPGQTLGSASSSSTRDPKALPKWLKGLSKK